MYDMKAIRELADSVIGAADHLDPDDILSDAKMAARSICQDCRPLAAFVRDIADPTPLTVDVLVETVVRAGGKCSGDDAVRIGRLTFAICEIEVIVGVLIDGKHVPPELWPRTLSELAMLLAMMEGR